MHQYVNVSICNFAYFGHIFRKFSPKCKAYILGVLFTILGSFCSYLDLVGANYWPQNRPRKIPVASLRLPRDTVVSLILTVKELSALSA